MPLAASYLLDRVFATLDDIYRIHTTEAMGLRALSRAQEWVCLRFRLLRKLYAVPLAAGVPLYDRVALAPQAVSLVSASLNGQPVYVTPLRAVRYRDPQWLHTPGTPSLLYCVRWRFWGFYPVPTSAQVALLTCLAAPTPLTEVTQHLEVPDGYADHAEQVSTGLVLCGRERTVQEGRMAIQAGLELTGQQARPFAHAGV
jgi:hypothetical protein